MLKTAHYDDLAAPSTPTSLGTARFASGPLTRRPRRAPHACPSGRSTSGWASSASRTPRTARSSQLIHPVPALVAYLSRQTTLEPGDVISTGTPAGVGHTRGLFLRSGTEVRIEIEGIGTLVNTCA
ncbi:fumarylacetoacetate hydrolase family protein [Streptomyces sp. NBC_01275]|uniref:fumarylacetoacetate hydrolase family protein n=1 Tax=Streptomyces sp. NBC_01275 TaxID=2903807 RepID=UPI0022556974|nr:fumarylacetoacetate hydrolase family protein [Streptomyces sp. NBC_01275]MCX4760085.1 fumarylacetoacetate hydrolase family protein [Streptomyces sp. NBC_01275]